MVLARSVTASPGGGFIGLAAAREVGAEVGLLSVLGTGPNSYMARKTLRRHHIDILSEEVVGDIGVAIQLVEGNGSTTVILSTGIESEPPIDSIASIPVQPGDVVLAHGAAMAYPEVAVRYAQWVSHLPEDVTVVLCPSPMIDQVPASVWPSMLQRANIVTTNLRESSLLPHVLAMNPNGPTVEECLRDDVIQVRRMGAMGCEYRIGRCGEPVLIPAFPVDPVDTAGVGDTHVAVMCGLLAQGWALDDALLTANAAGAVMISHSTTLPIPTMAEIERVMAYEI